MASNLSSGGTAQGVVGIGQDQLRQILNVILAISQIATIIWTFAVNTSFSFETLPAYEPPIIPAGYTFAVWFVIYGGALAYAVYQALPGQRTNPLLRRIGWWTAAAFGSATLWAIPAGLNMPWPTVLLIFAMFATLLGAFVGFSRGNAPSSTTERRVVVVPLSIYLGYVTIATIANTASAFAQSGVTTLAGLAPASWAVIMLIVAGAIAVLLTRWSWNNAAYALTIVWALIGIVVANLTERPNGIVALTAGLVAAVVIGALALGRRSDNDRTTPGKPLSARR